jgi:hypothetical protein
MRFDSFCDARFKLVQSSDSRQNICAGSAFYDEMVCRGGRAMRWFWITIFGVQVVLVNVGRLACAEMPQANLVTQTESSVGAVLGNMSSRAAVVFVGQVQRIERKEGIVEVTFCVDRTVLGQVGRTYTVREWTGLWAAGEQRYRVGQRAMVFLHGVNAAGLSSPLDGMHGVVPLVPMGADAEPLLDVRWLASRVIRATGSPIPDANEEAISLSDAITVVKQVSRPRPEPVSEPVRLPLPLGYRPLPAPVKTFGVVPEKTSVGGGFHEAR